MTALEEALWMCQEADKHSFIKGIVAGIDITSDKLNATLNILTGHPRIVGIRHILDLEPDKEWLAREATIKGLEVLQERGLTFDLLLRPHSMHFIPELSRKLPRLKMVVDHLAKPYIKDGLIEKWAEDMTTIAQNPNIFCKLSGMVTEADLKAWKEKDFEPYVKHVLNCFGPERCMFGSDWPVCGLAGATYSDVFNMMLRLVSKLSPGNEAAIFRDNAVRFYGLKI
ncbi:LOW QUALITY PROTEIN: uncharacterized protein LOC112575864 [Pomacea canaliculata]|uniref:LOW QUALITY PROTEIN: uncharacterized protein LOC112575864 n=1 Tax=Pomacea canaliculata TaxID=400727 RepID=UPI000D738101|nr:LOW QUALITY PROTEIN: uncharacterized protein LOC112575864 [Pomacea canaliculata]